MSDPTNPGSGLTKLTRKRLEQIEEKAEKTEVSEWEEEADPYYEPYFCDMISDWAEQMMFPEQWAADLGVTEMTLYNWITKFPEFARSYQVAITKLRAAFTKEMIEVARGKNQAANAVLYTLIAKKRFADLYGDPPPAQTPAYYTPTTGGGSVGQTIDGTIGSKVDDMETDDLQKELEDLRARHEVK